MMNMSRGISFSLHSSLQSFEKKNRLRKLTRRLGNAVNTIIPGALNKFRSQEGRSGSGIIMWNRKVFIRIIEVLLCIACVIALRVTEDESRRVISYLRYRSREWPLLNNVTWGTIGAALATATCGGYVIITTGLLIAAATGELRGRKTEIFLLGLGVILFGIVGALALASIENLPNDLVDNAAVLGALCLITALVFIADILMTTPEPKIKPASTQIVINKDSVKPIETITSDKDTRIPMGNEDKKKGEFNEAFEKVSDRRARENNLETSSNARDDMNDRHATAQRPFTADVGVTVEPTKDYDEGDIPFIDAERYQMRSSYLDGRHQRNDTDRYRDAATMVRNNFNDERNDSRIFYQGHDIIMRPSDEVDTPKFPSTRDTMTDTMFPKLLNPSVKIMRVDRDIDNNHFDGNGRYSDSSQYDNVPTRIAPGILKRGRDAFTSSTRSYRGPERNKDEIEMLEEWVGVLRKSTTGTQTAPALPSSPVDPGYVRHTVNNWPRDFKPKTPGSSPNHQ